MNWGLIGWVAGAVATLCAIKFVGGFIIDLFKSLFGKDARKGMIDSIGTHIHEASESCADKIREKAEQRKKERRAKKLKEDEPIIIIR